MGDIVSIKRYQEAREAKKHEGNVQRQYDEVMQYVVGVWELKYRQGKLGEHISSLMNTDYGDVLQLNNIKDIERDLGIRPVIFSPNSMPVDGQNGWVCGFTFNSVHYATPPMITEAHARAFGILLYIELTNHKKEGAI